jgi:hypothetical protein
MILHFLTTVWVRHPVAGAVSVANRFTRVRLKLNRALARKLPWQKTPVK